MGQHNSQPGQVGFGLQTAKGTADPATRFARLLSGSLGGDRTLMIPDPEIGGNRDKPGAYLGPVAFMGDLEFYPRMQMLALLMYGVLGAKSSTASASTNEVQTITTTGTPTGGTFKLRFRGQTTTAIAYNAAAAAIDSALEALSSIDAGAVTCTGGALPTGVVVTFTGAYAGMNVPVLEVVESALTGGTAPEVIITGSTPGMPPIGVHVLTPADTSPWLSAEERIGAALESFQYWDVKVNTLRIEAEATGYLKGTAGLIACRQASDFTEQTGPAYDTTPMMVGGQVTITLDGVALPSKSFNLEINNNIESDDFVLGSVYLNEATEKARDIKMGLTYRPQDSALWKAAMYGDAAASAPQAGPAYSGQVSILIESFETIGDEVAGTPFSLLIEIPHAVIAPHKFSPSGDDVIQNDLELTLVRPDPLVPIMTVTITNDLATVS